MLDIVPQSAQRAQRKAWFSKVFSACSAVDSHNAAIFLLRIQIEFALSDLTGLGANSNCVVY